MSLKVLVLICFVSTGTMAQSIRPVAVNQADPTPFIPNGVTTFGPVILDSFDLDSDGLPNAFETANQLNPADPSDALTDADEDGLLNLEEFQLGTNPQLPDSDGDGFMDLEEFIAGTDPLDDQSFPSEPPVIPSLVSLTATPSSGVITVNSVLGTAPVQLIITAHYSDGSQQNITDDFRTHYQTDNPGVADVTQTGALMGLSAGSSIITVTRHPLSIQLPFTVDFFLPEIIGKTSVSNVNAVAIQNNYLFLGRGSGLDVYDVTDPTTPIFLTTADPGGSVADVLARGNQIYLALPDTGLKIYDLSTLPASPVELSSLLLPGLIHMAFEDGRLAAAMGDRVALIDVRDPASPEILQTAMHPATRTAYANGILYTLGDSNLSVYQAGVGNIPDLISQTLMNNARDLSVNLGRLYLATSSGLRVVDVLDPASPATVGTLTNFNAFASAYINGHVFLAETRFTNLVPVIHVKNPSNPILAANPQFSDDANGLDVDAYGNLAAVALDEGFQLVRWFKDPLNRAPVIHDFTVNPLSLIGGEAIDINVSASDDVFLAGLELWLDGQLMRRVSSNTASFRISTDLTLATQTLELQLRAIDGSGATTLSPIQTITLEPDDQPPTVSILSPMDGGISPPGNLIVSAEVMDNVGIEQVSLYLDNVLTQTLNQPPYQFTAPIGIPATETVLEIRIEARDVSGNIGSAQIVTIIPSVAWLTLAPDSGILVGMNGALNLRATGLLSDGATQLDLTLDPGTLYESSDPAIAQVSTQGLVQALSNGSVQIQATNGGAHATSDFEVYATPPNPDDITPPKTAINGLAPNQTMAVFSIPYNLLSGFHDFAGVRLFYRMNTQGDFLLYQPLENPSGVFYQPTIAFDANQAGGDGLYEFYTSARDINGNLEPAPNQYVETLVDSGQSILDIPDGAVIAENDLTYDFRRVRINGGSVVMNGEHRFIAMEIINNGVLTHGDATSAQTHRLHIRTGGLTVDPTSVIDVTGKGFLGSHSGDNASSFAFTIGNTHVAVQNSGGSHGGLGGVGNGGERVPSYGDFHMPKLPGTGGSENGTGGNGGGVLRIEASTLNLDGKLLANGLPGSTRAGAGGSILIQTGLLTGTGLIEADGGNDSVDGGGGRVAIYYNQLDGFLLENVSAKGTNDSNHTQAGGAGTLFFKATDQEHGDLIVDNHNLTGGEMTTPLPNLGKGFSGALSATTLTDPTASFPVPNPVTGEPGLIGMRLNPNTAQNQSFPIINNTPTTITVAGDMTEAASPGDPYGGVILLNRFTIANRARVVSVGDRLEIIDRLEILGNSVLTTPFATTAEVTTLDMASGAVHIDASSMIDLTGKGYLGSNQGDNPGSFARTFANVPTTIPNSGGSFGGLGGVGDNNLRVPSYGDFRIPDLPGTGGSENGVGGNGGGVLSLESNTLELHGLILADGAPGSTRAGSGGSILMRLGTLFGEGLISANGGNDSIDGGGGRIAIYCNNLNGFNPDNIQARGASDSNSNHAGGAGTVYLQSEALPLGRLILDNHNTGSAGITTVLPDLKRGRSTALTASSLTDQAAHFPLPDPETGYPGLAGMRLVPNIDRQESFLITANTETTIWIEGDMTGLASPGDTYCGATQIDELSITRNTNATFGSNRVIAMDRVDVTENGTLTIPYATTDYYHQLDLQANLLHIGPMGVIDATDKGYLGSNRGDNASIFARTLGNAPTTIPNSGGSYGGLGGIGDGFLRVPGYGEFRRPTLPGTGGSESGFGGNGGGVLRIDTKQLQLEGGLHANGSGGNTRAGSGGSIYIQTETLSGAGLITANGGNDSIDGGGGRIALYYQNADAFDLNHIQAYGADDSNAAHRGGAGTIYLHSDTSLWGDLIVDNNGHAPNAISTTFRFIHRGRSTSLTPTTLTDDNANFPIPDASTGNPGLVGLHLCPNAHADTTFEIISNTATTITVDGDLTTIASPGDPYCGVTRVDNLTIMGKAFTTFGNNRIMAGDQAALLNGGILTIPYATTSIHYNLELYTNRFFIDDASELDVTEKGYLGAHRGDNTGDFGHALGNLPSEILNSGGSHAGLGGVGNGLLRNPAYGDIRTPTLPGSGGSEAGSAGNGGGALHIKTNDLEVDGAIRANGGVGTTRAGSGGSILIHGNTLTGSGLITANGGNDSIDGGGGRIALYFNNPLTWDISRIQAHGGPDSNHSQAGGAGTVFIKTPPQTHGRLIIDNNGQDTSEFTTIMRSIGPGLGTGLAASTLTHSGAAFPLPQEPPGALGLVGLELNPNMNQNQTFTITHNTMDEIMVEGDMTQVASPGDPYIGVYFFDILEVRGKARALTEDKIAVTGSKLIIDDAILSAYEVENASPNLNIQLTGANLTLSNEATGSFDQMTLVDSNLTLFGNGFLSGNDLSLANSTITIEAADMTAFSALKLDLTGTLQVDAASVITTSGKGYPGGLRADNPDPFGITLGFTPGSQLSDGGSYGGLGGLNSAGGDPGLNFVNPVYGNMMSPTDPGSGGGGTINGRGAGGNGGGVIEIRAQNLELHGAIAANGENGQSSEGAPGSGGAIWIDLTGDLLGDGLISANGGIRSGSGSGGGGGGRIAVYANDDLSFTGSIEASGGAGNSPGGAGTVFSQTQARTTLRVENKALAVVTNGVVESMASNSLAAQALLEPHSLAGLILKSALDDEVGYDILDNNETQVFLKTDLDQTSFPVGNQFLVVDPNPTQRPLTPLTLAGKGFVDLVEQAAIIDWDAAWAPHSLTGQMIQIENQTYPILDNDRHSINLETHGRDLRDVLKIGQPYSGAWALNELLVLGSAHAAFEGQLHLLDREGETPIQTTGLLTGDQLTVRSNEPIVFSGGEIRLNLLELENTPALYLRNSQLMITSNQPLRAPELYVKEGSLLTNQGNGGPSDLNIEVDWLQIDGGSRIDVSAQKPLIPSEGDALDEIGQNGGQLAIEAGVVLLNGLLAANGEECVQNGPAGSGGLVRIKAIELKGDGYIRANGGHAELPESLPGEAGRIELDVGSITLNKNQIEAQPGKIHKSQEQEDGKKEGEQK